MKSICREKNDKFYQYINPGSREKRWVFLIGIVVVVVAAAIGGSITYSIYKTKENADAIASNRQKLDELEERIDHLAKESGDLLKTNQDILAVVDDIKSYLKANNYSMIQKFEQIPFMVWDVSYAASVNSMLSATIPLFVHYFKMMKVYPPVWEFLGFSVPLKNMKGNYDVYNQIIPQDCTIDTVQKRIKIKARVYTPSDQFVTLSGHPFVLINETSDMLCELIYR